MRPSRNQSLKHQVVSGVLWRFCERFGSQIITLATAIILARILDPEDFGTVALMALFIELSRGIVSCGFISALIQKKDTDALDFNSVFYLSLSVSILLYGILFALAKPIADFYGKPVLIQTIRIAALILIPEALNGVQNAYLSRKMLFHLGFWISIPSIILSGLTGIALALTDHGIWALVWSSVVSSFSGCILRWYIIGWRPSLTFSFHRIRALFKYGGFLFLAGMLDTLFSQIHGLLIGKLYSVGDLAFYNRGDNIPKIATVGITGAIEDVSFAALSKMQTEQERLRNNLRKIVRASSFLLFPALTGLAILAKPFIMVVFTSKWASTIPFLDLACLFYVFQAYSSILRQGPKVIGNSSFFLKMELVKKIVLAIAIVATIRIGVLALAIGRTAAAGIGVLINQIPNAKLLGYPYRDFFKDITPSIGLSILMAIPLLGIRILDLPFWAQLTIGFFTGIIVYGGFAFLLKIPEISTLALRLRRLGK